MCGEPAASRIATPPWAAEQQARWPNHSCIDSLCKRGQSPLHICWLARWGPGRPAPLGASRCVEKPAAPHIAAPPWAAGRQDALDEHRGTSRATSDSLCQLYGAAALPDHPGRPPREAGHPPASTQGWSSACVSGWASRTRWTSTSCIDASYSLCITRAAALPDHPSRPLSCEARSPV